MSQAEADAFDGHGNGDRIPDLSRIPRERWLDALRPLTSYERAVARDTVTSQAEVASVMALIGELICEDRAASARAMAAAPARLPAGDPPALPEVRRQVNFRMGESEHGRLIEAARLYGMRPNVLARVLTVRGVDRALAEARREP